MTNRDKGRFFIFLRKILLFIPIRIYWGIFRPSSRGIIRWAAFFILILTILAGSYDYPKYWDQAADFLNGQLDRVPQLSNINFPRFVKRDFRLGLDLKGGAHLVYQADLSKIKDRDRSDAMQGVRDVVERRVNALGVAEPVVQVAGGDRLLVELAGVLDVNEAIRKIGETPLLEFKEQNTAGPASLTDEQKKQIEESDKKAADKASDTLRRVRLGREAFEAIVKEVSQDDPAIKDNGGDLGFISQSRDSLRFGEAEKIGLGRVSKTPLKTDLGYEILRVDEKRQTEKEAKANHILICYKGATRCEKDTSKEDALKKIQELKAKATPQNFVQLAKENSTEPGADQTGGDLGFQQKGNLVKPFEEVLFAIKAGTISDVVETEFGYHLIYKTDERPIIEYKLRRILFKTLKESDFQVPQEPFKNTGLTGAQLKRAQVQFDQQTGDIQVGLEFNDEGRKLFKEITERNLQKPVAIFLDGQPISVPTVQSVISDGRAVITGRFSLSEAKQLTQRLNAGALPVPINLISQQKVEASLGNDSLNASLLAALIGFAAVGVFMILYYRLPGLISVVALFIYSILDLALFKLIGVTLTLAGIAGFILSIGMAVDANVLIFERVKEELLLGKTLAAAIDEGFRRAWSSIRDSNITTLAGSFILFWFGTSLIKGFGLTLTIGILTSMFSALVISKVILKLVAGWRISRVNSFYLGKGK